MRRRRNRRGDKHLTIKVSLFGVGQVLDDAESKLLSVCY